MARFLTVIASLLGLTAATLPLSALSAAVSTPAPTCAPTSALKPAPTRVRTDRPPIVIAHRGSSAHRPEHTLAAYRFALLQGADFIEADLVATADGVLIARHENALATVQMDDAGDIARDARGLPVVAEQTTNVAELPQFTNRLSVKTIDGRRVAGWFSEDFTLAEIKTLRARERLPALRPASSLYDDRYEVPTLRELLTLMEEFEQRTGREAGLYIEIKHPTYFLYEGRNLAGDRLRIDLAALLLETLVDVGFTDPQRLFIQSFEVESLLALHWQLRRRNLPVPLVQLFGDIFNQYYVARPYDLAYHAARGDDLRAIYGDLVDLLPDGGGVDITYADLATPAVLACLGATYAAAIGLPKHNILLVTLAAPQDVNGDGSATQRAKLTGEIGSLVESAAAAGLALHPFTLRAEEPFLVRDGQRVVPVAEEVLRLLRVGAGGFFIDQPAEGRAAVDAFLRERARPTVEHRVAPAATTGKVE